MLHDFLRSHRTELIGRCRPRPTGQAAALDHGAPALLDQLIGALSLERSAAALQQRVDAAIPLRWLRSRTRRVDTAEIAVTARRNGLELSRQGFTVEQVVQQYSDLSRAITTLAGETHTAITVGEFETLNRCLDDAITGAVTEFCYQREAFLTERHSRLSEERARLLLESLQSHVETATLALAAIGAGNVGLKGATGSILGVSLDSMRTLIGRSLAEARESIGLLARH